MTGGLALNGEKYLMPEPRGATKTMPKINQNVLKKVPIPIPPRKEIRSLGANDYSGISSMRSDRRKHRKRREQKK